MANRIGPVDQGLINKLGTKLDESSASRKVGGEPGVRDSAGKSPQSTGDTVQLTDSARLLERLEKTLASLPDVDAARVSEIKAAIQNGDYEIDAGAIADAMMRFDRSLGE